MKRILIASLLLLAIGLAGIFALPLLISSETVRTSLLERAREVTGRDMQFTGDPRVSFSPFLGIEIQDVVFARQNGSDGKSPILSMPYLRAKLNLAAALTGEIRIDEFQFIQPRFNLTLYRSGNTSWTFPEGKVWRALREANDLRSETPTGEAPDLQKLSSIRLGRFSVEGGTIEFENEISGRRETITNFDGTLLWPNTRAGWTFDGQGIWRGDEVGVDLTAATPIMLLAGGASQVGAQIRSDTVDITFNGEANRFSDLFIRGEVSTTAPSLRRMIELFGGSAGVGATFQAFAADGMISGTANDLQLENANIKLDGNSYSGGLRFIRTEKKNNQLNGTLATSLLDLAPYVASISTTDGLESMLSFLGQAEVDLRLSAATASNGAMSLSDFAGGIAVRDNALKIDIGNAAIGDGLLVGNLQFAKVDNRIDTSIALDGSALDFSNIEPLRTRSAILPLGKSDIRLRLSSTGQSFNTLKSQMNGDFSLSMKNGGLAGLDFADLQSRGDNSQNDATSLRVGALQAETGISDLMLNVAISRGVGWIQNSGFQIGDFRGQLTGKADFRSGNLGVWGILRQAEQAEALEGTQFFLGGTLEQPLLVPEPGFVPDISQDAEVDSSDNSGEQAADGTN